MREAGLVVYGIGEKKTPDPFIVACDKFIYLEILELDEDESNQGKTRHKKVNIDKITPKVIRFLQNSVDDASDDTGWAFMGDVGSLISKKQPNFDARNFGFEKLTPLFKSLSEFEIDQKESASGGRFN